MAKTLSEHRLLAGLILCLSGLALVPFNPLPNRVFGWEQLAGVYESIFGDDFEEGSAKHWDRTAPENLRVFPSAESDAYDQEFRIDERLLSQFEAEQVLLMSGFSAVGEPIFSVEARWIDPSLEVRAAAALDDGAWQTTEWLAFEAGARLGIEWRRGDSTAQDGFVYLSVDGELSGWLTELDNDTLGLAATGLTQSAARTLLLAVEPRR